MEKRFLFLCSVGCGNLAQVTAGGRMFCVIYALIGITLTLTLLAVVGHHIVHYLNETCAWLVNRIRRYHAGYEFESADVQINAPVWVALPIIFLFLAIMSLMYCALEGWDFGTALFFIFITFTTIGFGDVVSKSAAVRLLPFLAGVVVCFSERTGIKTSEACDYQRGLRHSCFSIFSKALFFPQDCHL